MRPTAWASTPLTASASTGPSSKSSARPSPTAPIARSPSSPPPTSRPSSSGPTSSASAPSSPPTRPGSAAPSPAASRSSAGATANRSSLNSRNAAGRTSTPGSVSTPASPPEPCTIPPRQAPLRPCGPGDVQEPRRAGAIPVSEDQRRRASDNAPLLFVRLSDQDFDRFHGAHIPYSGSTGKGAVKGYEPFGPSLATFTGCLVDALAARPWRRTELTWRAGQWLALRLVSAEARGHDH